MPRPPDDPQLNQHRREIGDAVRDARLRQRLTQEQVALLIGTDRPTVVRIERGQVDPRLSTLLRIASVLQVRLVLAEDDPLK